MRQRADPVRHRLEAAGLSQDDRCMRTPACGYPPKTLDEIYGKVLAGKAVIVDGEMEIVPGVRVHPAFRAHTAGSQLLEVPTSVGKLAFASDASSWEGIRDWMIANPQQTDTVQQLLAYEKCYKITGCYQNCVAGHDPGSYTDKYPLTKNAWVGTMAAAWRRSRWLRASNRADLSKRDGRRVRLAR